MRVVTRHQAKVKDMGMRLRQRMGGYRTRFKRHTSNIENKTQTTDRDGHATSPTTNASN